MNLPEIIDSITTPAQLRELAKLATERADQLQQEGIARAREELLARAEEFGVDPAVILGIAAKKPRGNKNSKHRGADNH